MVAALGAVTGFDDWAPTLLANADPLVLQTELDAAVRDVLGLGALATSTSGRRDDELVER